jgi:hypothetical protein
VRMAPGCPYLGTWSARKKTKRGHGRERRRVCAPGQVRFWAAPLLLPLPGRWWCRLPGGGRPSAGGSPLEAKEGLRRLAPGSSTGPLPEVLPASPSSPSSRRRRHRRRRRSRRRRRRRRRSPPMTAAPRGAPTVRAAAETRSCPPACPPASSEASRCAAPPGPGRSGSHRGWCRLRCRSCLPGSARRSPTPPGATLSRAGPVRCFPLRACLFPPGWPRQGTTQRPRLTLGWLTGSRSALSP